MYKRQDPNWGRILAAVGYAGVDVPVDNVDIMIGGLPVMLASSPVAFDDEEMKDVMHVDEVTITVDLHACLLYTSPLYLHRSCVNQGGSQGFKPRIGLL